MGDKANELKTYEATEARFIGGQHRNVGDPVQMTERCAKYYLSPNGSGLAEPAAARTKSGGKNAKAEG